MFLTGPGTLVGVLLFILALPISATSKTCDSSRKGQPKLSEPLSKSALKVDIRTCEDNSHLTCIHYLGYEGIAGEQTYVASDGLFIGAGLTSRMGGSSVQGAVLKMDESGRIVGKEDFDLKSDLALAARLENSMQKRLDHDAVVLGRVARDYERMRPVHESLDWRVERSFRGLSWEELGEIAENRDDPRRRFIKKGYLQPGKIRLAQKDIKKRPIHALRQMSHEDRETRRMLNKTRSHIDDIVRREGEPEYDRLTGSGYTPASWTGETLNGQHVHFSVRENFDRYARDSILRDNLEAFKDGMKTSGPMEVGLTMFAPTLRVPKLRDTRTTVLGRELLVVPVDERNPEDRNGGTFWDEIQGAMNSGECTDIVENEISKKGYHETFHSNPSQKIHFDRDGDGVKNPPPMARPARSHIGLTMCQLVYDVRKYRGCALTPPRSSVVGDSQRSGTTGSGNQSGQRGK